MAVLSTAAALRGSKSNTNNGFGLWSRSLQRGENTRGIEYPDFRFVPWCILDEEIKAQAEGMRCKFWIDGWSPDGRAIIGSMNKQSN